jgi:hypothetical protein
MVSKTPRPRGRAPKGMKWDPTGGKWVPTATPVGSKRSRGSATPARSAKKPRVASPNVSESKTAKKPGTIRIKNLKSAMRTRKRKLPSGRTPVPRSASSAGVKKARTNSPNTLTLKNASVKQLIASANAVKNINKEKYNKHITEMKRRVNVTQNTNVRLAAYIAKNAPSPPKPTPRGKGRGSVKGRGNVATPKNSITASLIEFNKLSSKEEVLMYIYTKIQESENSRDAYPWAVLYTIMNKIFATRLVSTFNKKDVDKLFEDVKLHLSKSRTGNSRNHSSNLTDEELVDMLFLMYLDGVHDKYLKDVNFPQFLTTGYVTEIIDKPVLNFVKDYASSNRITPLFQTFYGLTNVNVPQGIRNNILSLYNGNRIFSEGLWSMRDNNSKKPTKEIIGASWEANFKKNIETLFPRQVKNVINVDSIDKLVVSKVNGNIRIYTGIDQEAESQPISTIIETSMTNRGYFLYPYISLGVLLDPGNTMVRRMLRNDIQHILSSKPTVGLMYDVEPTTISFSWRNNNFFVLDSGKIELPPISKNSRDLLGKPVLTVKVNGSLVPIGASSGEAKATEVAESKRGKFTKGFIEFGKFMGDGLQYMYLASKRRQRNPRAFCSGDGMACASYMFYSKLFEKTDPPLIVDGGARQGIKLTMYNIGEYVNLKSTKPIPVQVASNLTGQGAVAGRNSPNGNVVQSENRLRRIVSKTPGALNLSPKTLEFLLARTMAPK